MEYILLVKRTVLTTGSALWNRPFLLEAAV
jgi:hypothetical protein